MEVEETSNNSSQSDASVRQISIRDQNSTIYIARTMEQTVEGILNIEVMLQDSIVTGNTDEAHLENENIEAVLKILEFCGLEIDKHGLLKH